MAKPIKAKVEACRRLIKTCESKLLESDYQLYNIRGVEDLTRSDIETIIMYCEYYMTNKTIGGLMPPRGDIATVLRKIELC